jgi:CBS-domain-containing membrane protein
MRVKDVMTPKVISVGVDETVVNAARLMLQQQISGLPVVDKKGQLVGIVTEGDFLRRGELGTQRRRLAGISPWTGQARPRIRSRLKQKN